MDIKVFELVIDEEDDSGVSAIALVDQPAIGRDFLKFKKEPNYKFQVKDEEKRIISGYAMVADLPIIRQDKEVGEHYVVFRKDTIEHIVDKFMRSNNNDSINLMHDPSRTAKDVFIIESIIVDEERGQFAPESFEAAPDGSWWVSMKVLSDEVWLAVKNQEFKGFSVEGGFAKLTPIDTEEKEIEEVINDLEAEFRSLEVKDNYYIKCKQFSDMSEILKKQIIKSNLSKIRDLFSDTEVKETPKETPTETPEAKKFAEVTTEDGTVLSIEPDVQVGAAVAVMGKEGAEAAPDGEYKLADSTIIVVEGGVITAIPEEEGEEEVVEEEQAGEEMNEENKGVQPKSVLETVSIEKRFSEMEAKLTEKFQSEINELKEALKAQDEKTEEFNTATADAFISLAKKPTAEPTIKPKFNKFNQSLTPFEDKINRIKILNKNVK